MRYIEFSPAKLFKTHKVTGINAVSIRKKFPARLAVGLLIAILIDTALQLVWKSAVLLCLMMDHLGLMFRQYCKILVSYFVIFLMGCQYFNWLMVLGDADLSYAQPVTSLSYVSVFFLSVLYLKEVADVFQIAGIIFVLVGVWFISQTDHLTQVQRKASLMSQTSIGVVLVVICTLLEGVGQVFLKKSVLGVVRWYLWISFGVVILVVESLIYTNALRYLMSAPLMRSAASA